jgi:hypothetical protein
VANRASFQEQVEEQVEQVEQEEQVEQVEQVLASFLDCYRARKERGISLFHCHLKTKKDFQ